MANPISATTPGNVCLMCGVYVPVGSVHVCTASNVARVRPLYGWGWTCPVCGNGCAPWLGVCPGPHTPPTSYSTSSAGEPRAQQEDQ